MDSKGKMEMVDADAVEARNPVVPSAPEVEASYIVLEAEGRKDEMIPDHITDYQARIEQFNQASAVKDTNDASRFSLDADEQAVILSTDTSKIKMKQQGNIISSENKLAKNEVYQYDPSDVKYGEGKLDKVDHEPTNYNVPKADHTKEYTFGSDNYETSDYKFES